MMGRFSEADLRRALRIAARIVDEYGDAFLPIFLRLEREVAALEQRKSAVERAREISRDLHFAAARSGGRPSAQGA